MQSTRSPLFSTAFLRRLQKMIPAHRGPPTELEKAIELMLQRISALFDRHRPRA